MGRRTVVLVALATLAACSETPTEAPLGSEAPEVVADGGGSSGGLRTYEVTIYNLTGGQPLTPPLVATHKRGLRAFRRGAPASEGVKEIAENGNTGPLTAFWNSHPKVHDVVMAAGPVLPYGSISFTVEAAGRANRLSWVSMLICTNDGFTGLAGLRLPHRIGDFRYRYVRGNDAGTEKNTESFSDMVPPCPALTGVDTDEMGTGMSNPALAENGRIHPHRGIHGIDDLIPGLHGWKGPVAKVVIKRIG